MIKEQFVNLLYETCDEVFDYQITDYEKEYFWKKSVQLKNQLNETPETAWDIEKIIDYEPVKQLRFRNWLASKGIEMTPRQVHIYIMAMDLVLIDMGFYEWEEA